jgi:hypothetical protein
MNAILLPGSASYAPVPARHIVALPRVEMSTAVRAGGQYVFDVPAVKALSANLRVSASDFERDAHAQMRTVLSPDICVERGSANCDRPRWSRVKPLLATAVSAGLSIQRGKIAMTFGERR